MIKKLLVLAIVLPMISFLSSCATKTETKTIHLSTDFNSSEIAWSFKKGNNTIKGQAFLRQASGGVVTCAGSVVELIPVSEYAKERVKFIYGNIDRGYKSYRSAFSQRIKFIPDRKEYYKLRKKTICDAQGNFKLTNLPDGEYFITTSVIWYVSNYIIPEGGFLMQRVKVKGGETKNIIMTY